MRSRAAEAPPSVALGRSVPCRVAPSSRPAADSFVRVPSPPLRRCPPRIVSLRKLDGRPRRSPMAFVEPALPLTASPSSPSLADVRGARLVERAAPDGPPLASRRASPRKRNRSSAPALTVQGLPCSFSTERTASSLLADGLWSSVNALLLVLSSSCPASWKDECRACWGARSCASRRGA